MILLNDKYKNIQSQLYRSERKCHQEQYRRYTSLSGRSLESVTILLDKYLDESHI